MRNALSKLVSAKTILILLSSMVLLHFFIMLAYTDYSEHMQTKLSREQVIERMLITYDVLQHAPTYKRQRMVEKLLPPQLRGSRLTNQPECVVFDPRKRLDEDYQMLLNQPGDKLCISMEIKSGEWLNLRGHVKSPDHLLRWLLIIFEGIAASSLLFAAWSIERFQKPLQTFKHAAEQLGINFHEDTELTVTGPSVVQETALAMTQMQRRIKELLTDRTLMLAAISHDLRTPLTRLKLRTQQITNETLLNKINSDIDELDSMINQILAFAQIEVKREEWQNLDLNSLLTTLTDDLIDFGHAIAYQAPEQQVVIKGHPLGLKRALSNLLNNAIKYAHRIELLLEQTEKNIHVQILDDGPGIPEHELENVLQPFYRVDKSRTHSHGQANVGLGLTISHQVILAHGGQLKIRNHPGKGLQIDIYFPR